MFKPLRVLQVVEASHGGVGRHVLDLCRGLVQRGHEVHVAWSPLRKDSGFEAELHAIEGLQRHEIAMRRGVHPSDAWAVALLVSYGRSHGPFSLLHGHSSKAGALARLAAVALGRPALYTPNAFRTTDPTLGAASRLFYRCCERGLATFGSEIIAVSEDERTHAVELGLDPRRMHVVLNGIDQERPAAERIDRAMLGIPADATVVGFVGRLVHQKAPERLIDVAARMNRRDVRWVVVGDGPQERALRERAGENGLESRFHWLGARDGFSAMPVFDVLLMPSRYEGMPYVLIEALTHGLPIVVSDVGGARHAVRNGINGFVVAEGDLDATTDALRQLLDDATLRKTMAARSRTLARHFTARRMVAETEQVYRIALERHDR